MIFGIGTDLVSLERVERVWARHGTSFAQRILMPVELERFDVDNRPVRYLAMRFAAKEAIVKALGTGFARGIWLRDVGIRPAAGGRPEPVFSARAERVRQALGVGPAFVTLSDEAGMIVAVAVMLMAGSGGGYPHGAMSATWRDDREAHP